MKDDTLIGFDDPAGFSVDPLTEVLRKGARDLLAQAVEAEVAEFPREYTALTDDAGRQRLVRHGHLPEREILTGIGSVSVKVPRDRVRVRGTSNDSARIRFTSSLLPPYFRKAKSVEYLLPWLYLKGISTGDFGEALGALLGANAEGLSSSTISRLKAGWREDYERWRKRDLSARRYVYLWADGVYFKPRMDSDKQCMLVIIGADEWGAHSIAARSEPCVPPNPWLQQDSESRALPEYT